MASRDYDSDDYSPSRGMVSPPPEANGVAKKADGKNRLSVERIYQKKTQLEHILLRPDTYIGSVQPVTEKMWVVDEGTDAIINREITYVPGLYKIFDEILVNAADNKVRDAKMDTIRIDINPEKNEIKIFNNGQGIPVAHHKKENMFVPTMIFGHLLTSSNFNDDEEKVTGGRNGYGAKLCNVFSKKFTVETASKEYKKDFKQSWADNMSKASEAKVKEFSGSDFTRVTFQPDLAKFNMTELDKDTVALLSRRAYDVAASTHGVKVYLNGKRVPIKSFKDYVDHFLKGHEDETGNQIKAIYEHCSERWEVAVAVSDNGFQQMSFVNSIATTKGGRHIEHVSKLVESSLVDVIKKKNKGGITIKPHQIRNHMWLFVNCLIVNPTFDSQTKENMTLQVKQFGSSCKLSDKFVQQVSKSGIVESVLAWSKFKQEQQLKSKQTGKKTNKLKGIAKLEDANDAGTRNSLDCTLILTEGDSAKSLAVAGLGVIGRDKYGVYPLRGKLLNVREATHKQIMENKEINELVKIVGLQYKKKYLGVDDLKTLRYGKIMIMTDQDQDGSHIKGLLINFVHHNWPELLKLPFLEEFITPIVKASKGSSVFPFFSIPEFSEWKKATPNWATYKIKYYKGLGTSTSVEAKEYFTDMLRHRIKFRHQSIEDDNAISMAFSKKATELRKDWLTNWMEEGKRRKELGLSEVFLYEKNTTEVTYSDFINKELVLFSNLDNERSIPSIVDGFKPGQRKVMFTCLKRNDKREVKVAQLAGSVGETSAYHHGEASLMGTIINLAQNFVGSNNINLLQPIGQFGTRLAGGKDHASPRYIFTMMSPLARLIFNVNDDPILKYLTDDNQRIEPEWYVPILPMVLVNGADGIGTGWMTKLPNYSPREIVQNLLRMLEGQDTRPMIPSFKNFTGTIEELDHQRYVINGEIAELSDTKVEITELPIRTWTQTYKEQVMEALLNGSEKTPAMIQDYKEYHTDKTVRFVVQMAADKMQIAREKGLHQFFKLQTTMSSSSMVLFDKNGCLRKYETVDAIMKEFFDLRLEYYGKRKKYLEGMLEAEASKLSNQARFIVEKCDGSLVVENKKKKVMVAELIRRGFDADPVKRWKALISQGQGDDEAEADPEADDSTALSEDDAKDADYDYLMGLAMWNLTAERKEELLKKRDEKLQELKNLRGTTKEQLWKRDLSEFLAKLDEVEKKEKEEDQVGPKKTKSGKAVKKLKDEAMPSPHGLRIAPRIPDELRTKAAKAVAAKDRKEAKKARGVGAMDVDEKDEFDMLVESQQDQSLSEKFGLDKIMKKPAAAPRAKKAAAAKKDSPTKQPKKKKVKADSWNSSSDGGKSSDSEADGFLNSSNDALTSSMERKSREGVRRAAASARTKYVDSDSGGSDSEEEVWTSTTKTEENKEKDFEFDRSSSLSPSPAAPKRPLSSNALDDDDDDDDDSPVKPKKSKAAAAKPAAAVKAAKKAAGPKKTEKSYKPLWDMTDDSDKAKTDGPDQSPEFFNSKKANKSDDDDAAGDAFDLLVGKKAVKRKVAEKKPAEAKAKKGKAEAAEKPKARAKAAKPKASPKAKNGKKTAAGASGAAAAKKSGKNPWSSDVDSEEDFVAPKKSREGVKRKVAVNLQRYFDGDSDNEGMEQRQSDSDF